VVASNGTLTVSGITEGVKYVGWANVGGSDHYLYLGAFADSAAGGGAAEAWKPLAPIYLANAKDFGGSYQAGRYRKNGTEVELEGVATVTGVGGVCNLPAGYQPTATHYFPTNTAAFYEVTSGGNVAATAGGNLTLDTIRFSTL
jgi:hypothetical protein